MLSFLKIVPFMIPITIIICFIIARGVKKKYIYSMDGLFSIIGLLIGLIITLLNLRYSNNYMFTLGPIITITCTIYLRFKDKILDKSFSEDLIGSNILKIFDVLYWICLLIAAYSFHTAELYHRPISFFLSYSLATISLGVEIIYNKPKNSKNIKILIAKIFILSALLKASGWFISPYPVGHDSWAHYEYINNFLNYGHIQVDEYPLGTGMANYYTDYPIMHLLVCAINLIGNINIKQSMYVISIVLTLSTIFAYFIMKNVTNDETISLFSLLLLNISDHHNTWGIIIVAMSFGIAIYTIIIYLLMNKNVKKNQVIYRIMILVYIYVIIYAHIISAFIALISITFIGLGQIIYFKIYTRYIDTSKLLFSSTLVLLFMAFMIIHWMSPESSIFDEIVIGLSNSLNADSHFLNRPTSSNIRDSIMTLVDIFGFLIYVVFGIIGSLICISKKYSNDFRFGLMFLNTILFFTMFSFPLFGMGDIVSFRWPAFIYITFIIYVGIGMISTVNLFTKNREKITVICILMFVSSFSMTTTYYANTDSPILGEKTTERLVWTESEMELFKTINDTYNGIIISDLQTEIRPFRTYLKREHTNSYRLNSEGIMDWNYTTGKLIIWRKSNLQRPVQLGGVEKPSYLLEDNMTNKLEGDFNKLYNSGEACAYL